MQAVESETEALRCWCRAVSSRADCTSTVQAQAWPTHGCLPMSGDLDSTRYRAIGGPPTRRIEEILLSFMPWSLTCR